MASESVAISPEQFDAPPVQGNYTSDASMHLWCADALSHMVASPETPLGEYNDDIQDAIRYLLSCEVARAKKAYAAELAANASERRERENANVQ